MNRKLIVKIVSGICFFLVPVLLFYWMEAFEHNALIEVRSLAQWYNILLFELMALILLFATGSGKIALRIETVLAMVFGLVNHYVMEFRSTPFVPWDVFSIKTAASVVGNYEFMISKEVAYVCITMAAIFFLLRYLDVTIPKNLWIRLIPMGCASAVLVGFVTLLGDPQFQSNSYLYPYLFTPAYMTQVNGMAVTFAMDMAYMYVEKPDDYSEEKAKEILAQYETNQEVQDRPNIIVIMNEAFSDVSVLGDFTTNQDYMPFLHSLQYGAPDTVTGNLTVSVCGGNTANTEFEFLTGHTMDFLPMGSIPYQQYITDEIPSLANQLKMLGYTSYGIHPYNASGWKRDEIYPLLGLDTNYFLRDFTSRIYVRNYVSDQTAYKKIIDIYENKGEEPLFVFEVTMQNHGGYTEEHEDFSNDIYVEEFENVALNQYLSLIRLSDQALEELIAYFSNVDEKTVIVFFGDHQPNDSVIRPILQYNGVTISQVTEERYIVPYLMWANYDVKEATGQDTDISFLGANLLKYANMPTTAYQNFLLELEEVLNAADTSDAAKQKAEEYTQMYQILQYYFMFDNQEE